MMAILGLAAQTIKSFFPSDDTINSAIFGEFILFTLEKFRKHRMNWLLLHHEYSRQQ